MRFIFSVFVLVFLIGCVPRVASTPKKITPTLVLKESDSSATSETNVHSIGDVLFPSELYYPEWTPLMEGALLREYALGTKELIQDIIAVVRFDQQHWKLQVSHDPKDPKPVQGWQRNLRDTVVINGTFFVEENFQPAGYMRINGEASGSQRLPYVGALIMENNAQLVYDAFGKFPELSSATTMITSYPMLLWQGKKLTTGKSTQTSRRTAVALTANNEVLLLATQRFSLSLDDFATWMVESDLDITHALNLDGGGSTGMSVRTETISYDIIGFDAVPNVLSLKPLP